MSSLYAARAPKPFGRLQHDGAQADRWTMGQRLRHDDGFALIELLVAMTVLTVGILAVASAFTAGTASLRRSSRDTTAATLADTQMELYRALTYSAIQLDTTAEAATDTAYKSDPALAGSPTKVLGSCATLPPECNPSRAVVGPDGFRYRIDTYVVYTTPTNGRQAKDVTVVVRNAASPSALPYARVESLFDAATGT